MITHSSYLRLKLLKNGQQQGNCPLKDVGKVTQHIFYEDTISGCRSLREKSSFEHNNPKVHTNSYERHMTYALYLLTQVE
jgi:hypothetical protein